jgi:hypothetical protein
MVSLTKDIWSVTARFRDARVVKVGELLQLRVLGFGLLQDGDVTVVVC